MTNFKEFIIFKNNKILNEKAPTHRVMATINNELVEIGGGWARESKSGNKFLSIKLKDVYKDKNGYSIKIEKPDEEDNEEPPLDAF